MPHSSSKHLPSNRHPPHPTPGTLLQDEVQLNGAIVLPHKDLKESVMEPGTIIM